MAHHTHEHRGTDLREPRPSKSRAGVSYTAWREGSAWIERRVKPSSGQDGQEENDDAGDKYHSNAGRWRRFVDA